MNEIIVKQCLAIIFIQCWQQLITKDGRKDTRNYKRWQRKRRTC